MKNAIIAALIYISALIIGFALVETDSGMWAVFVGWIANSIYQIVAHQE